MILNALRLRSRDSVQSRSLCLLAPSLTCIFNQSLLTGIYPSDWKLANVTPIFKNGFKTDLNNYRPISVIPAVAKIFEKIIYDQLHNYLNVNDLLTSCQSQSYLANRLQRCNVNNHLFSTSPLRANFFYHRVGGGT